MASIHRPAPDPAQRLRRLIGLRWVAVVAEFGLVALAGDWLGAHAALVPVALVCLAQLALNLVSLLWLQRRSGASDAYLFAQLLFDIAALTVIAYLAGGSTNPLISLYLLWIAVGAAMLDARFATALAAVSIAAYSAVNFIHAEVHIHDHEKALQVHLIGMWAIFVFSAITICWSVLRLTAAVRLRDAELGAAREAALRSERVVALGNLAAGAAHELGTPLATMAVLAGELGRDPAVPSALRPDLALIQAQIAECKRIITELAVQAGTSRAEGIVDLALDTWLGQLLERFRRQRPRVIPQVHLDGTRPAPRLAADATLGQALLNLFNNAADASPDRVEIRGSWGADHLELEVLDRGPGIAAEVQERLGRDLVTTRAEGHGMGVVLAYAAIERSGGRLQFAARAGGGTMAVVHLPLQRLADSGRSPEA